MDNAVSTIALFAALTLGAIEQDFSDILAYATRRGQRRPGGTETRLGSLLERPPKDPREMSPPLPALLVDQQAMKFDGGRTRARTLDPLIKSQLLYQLSYAPIASAARLRAARAGV